MSKRTLYLSLLVVFMYSVIGCAPQAAPASTPTTTGEKPAAIEASTSPTKAPEMAADTPEASDEPILIGFAYVGPVSDGGWTMTHDDARKALEEAFPGKVRTSYIENMPYSEEASRTLEQFIADGAKMIFINSEYADFVTKVAEKHPDVIFLECNGHVSSNNRIWYYVNHWDPTYLIGMAAGLMTKTNKLGYIGSFPVSSVYASANAFQMGAQSVNPDVTTSVVLIDSWFDPAAANQAANALIDDGADFVMDIMDETAALQVEEKRGVWAATWNTDQRKAAPTKYVSSVSLDWKEFYKTEVEAFLDGTWKGNRFALLPIGQGVDRDAWGPNVPADVQEKVDAVREKMINDGFNPFVGPIKDTKGKVRIEDGVMMTPEELFRWDWAVEGVSGLPEN
ncbi:MAG: BMP family ABC transporter substrate-binding protein [Anaerolineaceae bacterium]|nr:BMP family ABC transporter substrate-binding protein [Anaerolineaceae bacterium]